MVVLLVLTTVRTISVCYYFPQACRLTDIRVFSTDFELEALVSNELVVSVASSLAACVQLNSLSAEHRTWALLRLRQLLLSEHGPCINIADLLGSCSQPSDESCKVRPCTDPVMDAVSEINIQFS